MGICKTLQGATLFRALPAERGRGWASNPELYEALKSLQVRLHALCLCMHMTCR